MDRKIVDEWQSRHSWEKITDQNSGVWQGQRRNSRRRGNDLNVRVLMTHVSLVNRRMPVNFHATTIEIYDPEVLNACLGVSASLSFSVVINGSICNFYHEKRGRGMARVGSGRSGKNDYIRLRLRDTADFKRELNAYGVAIAKHTP